MDLTNLETSIITLPPQPTSDALLEYGDKIQAAKEILRQVESVWKGRMVDYIRANGEIVCGTVRYYVAFDKDTKCNDVRATTEAVMNAAAGDVDAFNGCLSTNAFKHGACKKLLPADVYAKLFTTTTKTVLKDGTAVEPGLQKVDDQFVR